MEMLLITLTFLACGSFLVVVGDFLGVHRSTVCKTIYRVCTAIALLRPQFLKMPENIDEVTEARQGFYNIARFPRCIGAIDCTHVRIQSPGGGKS